MGIEILMRARVGERIMEGGAESRGDIRIPRDGAGAGCWGGRLSWASRMSASGRAGVCAHSFRCKFNKNM